MTSSQVFRFLSGAAAARDVKIVAESGHLRWWNAWQIRRALRRGMPVAKIIGWKWFYGLKFATTRATLDPRPDSETLVDAVLRIANREPRTTILDLGTGTGCLVCAIVKNIPGAVGVGVDKSWRARRVARKNVRALGLAGRVEIRRGSFAQPGGAFFDKKRRPAKPDNNSPLRGDGVLHQSTPHQAELIIVANPPYIRPGEKINIGASFDPKMALYGGADGLKFYREIAKSIAPMCSLRSPMSTWGPRSSRGMTLFVEIGAGQAAAVKKIFAASGRRFIRSYKDLSARIRVLEFC
ncbi:MAG: peptide chain release factor N(5)-glutamine methyltransferase [Rickettsiales bacterium]|jgi:release factor glutamine methyltransferase|nr:peptide chain release factor N(5)-glutamine methyltransferase [Rickettsiales bacterium]